NRFLALASLVAGVTLTAGCATPATSVAMTATSATAVHQIGSDVSVAVSGGKETSSMGASQISDQAFAQALRDSIEKSGLFAKVSPSGARYKLTGFIGQVDQPLLGFLLTVKMEVSYTLVDTQSNSDSRPASIPAAIRQVRNRVSLLISCGEPILTRGTSVHPYDAEPDDQVRLDGLRRSGDKTRPDNSQVCRHIIARRKERG